MADDQAITDFSHRLATVDLVISVGCSLPDKRVWISPGPTTNVIWRSISTGRYDLFRCSFAEARNHAR